MTRMTQHQAEDLAAFIAGIRPDWGMPATLGALSGVVYRHGNRETAELIGLAAILATIDPDNTPEAIGQLDGPAWLSARAAILTDGDGRQYRDGHSRRVLTAAAEARKRFSIEAHNQGIAAARRALQESRTG